MGIKSVCYDIRNISFAAGQQVSPSSKIRLNAEEQKYVCRAGHKLEKALTHFQIDVSGKVALDSGQSTGGFSDCLLQNGVAKVSDQDRIYALEGMNKG